MDNNNLDSLNSEEREQRENFILVLAKTPEWIKFKQIIEGQILLRKTQLGQILHDQEQVANHNRLVGEIDGMHFVIHYPTLVEEKSIINRQMKELNKKAREG